MKKYFLTLTLLFGMMISYAGNDATALNAAENGLSQETTQGLMALPSVNDLPAVRPGTATNTVKCELKFEGTIDGKAFNLTLVVEGISCKELFKALMSAF